MSDANAIRHSPTGVVNTTVKERFNEFFAIREQKKRDIYVRVVKLGIINLLIGVAGCLVSQVFVKSDHGTKTASRVLLNLSIYIGVVGTALFTIVPTDEIDLNTETALSPSLGYRVCAIVVIVALTFASIMALFPPYTGLLLIPLTMWLVAYFCVQDHPYREVTFASRINAVVLCCFFVYWSQYYTIAADPGFVSDNNLVPSMWKGNTDELENLDDNKDYSQPYYAVIATQYLVLNVVAMYQTYEKSQLAKSGWQTSALYGSLYCAISASGIHLFEIFLSKLIFPGKLYIDKDWYSNLFASIGMTMPVFTILFVGHEKCFTFLARRFEYDVERLQEDGSFMAELAASSDVLDTHSNIRWVKHNVPELHISTISDDKFVNRGFWFKGKIVSTEVEDTSLVLIIELSCDENFDPRWKACYKEDRVEVIECNETATSPKGAPASIATWFKENHTESTCRVNGDTVVLREVIQKDLHNREMLLAWARNNLRVFDFENFTDDLMLKSPRELYNDHEKELMYSLSRPVHIDNKSHKKIDFFISHSWSDDAVSKCRELRIFANQFKEQHGRFPTFWFDKVCINQKSPQNALLCLPINLGACENILVLLGDTYLNRLWCLWEIFTLLSFTNKELALDRISIVQIGHAIDVTSLSKFGLDDAHCFDPNEEYKLRKIIFDVGIHRFEDCMKRIASILTTKVKGNDSLCAKCFKRSSCQSNESVDYGNDLLLSQTKNILRNDVTV